MLYVSGRGGRGAGGGKGKGRRSMIEGRSGGKKMKESNRNWNGRRRWRRNRREERREGERRREGGRARREENEEREGRGKEMDIAKCGGRGECREKGIIVCIL